MKTLVLGVTGRMAAGKDTACSILRELGVDEIDVDRLGHLELQEKREAVGALFGEAILTVDGVDRRALGTIVFSDPEALMKLEALLHPGMIRRAEEYTARARGPVSINAAILYKMGLDRLCDRVLFVDAPDEILAARAMLRSGLPREDVFQRLKLQKTVNRLPESVEVVIENDSSPGDFRKKVISFAESFFGEGPYGAAGTKWPQGNVYPEP